MTLNVKIASEQYFPWFIFNINDNISATYTNTNNNQAQFLMALIPQDVGNIQNSFENIALWVTFYHILNVFYYIQIPWLKNTDLWLKDTVIVIVMFIKPVWNDFLFCDMVHYHETANSNVLCKNSNWVSD